MTRNSQLAAYQTVSAQGAVDGADPHRLVLMLMDAIMERLAKARGCIEHGEVVKKTKLLHSTVVLVTELRGSLNLSDGGELAQNLSSLYEYIQRRLLLANLHSDTAALEEVVRLMGEIRSAWVAIGPEVRQGGPQAVRTGNAGAAPAAVANLVQATKMAGVR